MTGIDPHPSDRLSLRIRRPAVDRIRDRLSRWIPAFAGMTETTPHRIHRHSRESGNPPIRSLPVKQVRASTFVSFRQQSPCPNTSAVDRPAPAICFSFRRLAPLATLGAALALSCTPARAGEPTVIELFTSQSCYSCPPAEAFLGELVELEDLIALEFHVDYWDDLVYGSDGQWKDVFSDAAYSQRQRNYASRIPGSQVYTPQVVIDGVAQTVGSKQKRVLRLIESARTASKPARVSVQPEPSGGLRVTVDSATQTNDAVVLFARYDVRQVTEIVAGENKGKTLTNHHVVRELRRLGEWKGEKWEVSIADIRLAPNQSCAVIVQSAGQGAILGAAACPS